MIADLNADLPLNLVNDKSLIKNNIYTGDSSTIDPVSTPRPGTSSI